uniref:Cell cycle associated protein 1a n=1 Tax=Scophthalmus maximus TaxID=52904 RepID=A0A8D3E7I5_SCOMX
MPSAMVGNSAVQSASPDLGNGSHSEAVKQIIGVIEKKVRNMEKKKSKLDDYQEKKNKGERLNQDQLEALSKYQEIIYNVEFARDLQKSFLAMGQEVQKAVKKSARREQLQREEMEQRRLRTVLELQFLLDQLGDDSVRQDLKRPDASGSPLLSDADLTSLDELYKLMGPDRNYDVRLTDQYEEASVHLWELLEGRDKAVAGTTYKSLKDTLDKVLLSGYFDRAHTHQNGTCEQEEEQEEQPVVEESKAEEQLPEPGTASETYTQPIQVETTEFVNRQFIPETTYSSPDKDQVEEWTVEAQLVNSLQHPPPAQLTPEPTVTVNHVSPSPTPDPVVRKQAVQDLMAQMQGTYNFMQDSVLEFDGHALDPAIVSAQPMKPVPTADLQQMGCPSSYLKSLLPLQVFNMNAPVPPATEGQADPLKQPSQFPGGYGHGFNSQSESPVDQPDIPQETLQSGETCSSGGYEGYRPPFSNAASGGYGQTQFNTSRDYSNGTYQREGYQQGYKRGAAQGPRGLSRGNAQAMRS